MAGLLSKLLSRGADRQLKEFEKIAARINESKLRIRQDG